MTAVNTPGNGKLSLHQVEIIKELVSAGVPPQYVKTLIGCTSTIVHRYRRELGIPAGKGYVQLTRDELARYVEGIIAEVRARHNPWKRP